MVIHLNEHTLLIDEAFFATFFQLLTEGLTDFSSIPSTVVEYMKIHFFISGETVKTFGNDKELKIQLFIGKASSFYSYTTVVMAAIIDEINIK